MHSTLPGDTIKGDQPVEAVYGILIFLSWHLSTTAFVPASVGRAWLLWPFSEDAQSLLPELVALAQQPANRAVGILAGSASLGFIAASLALFGILLPNAWFRPLVIVAASASALLFVLFAGVWSLLPLTIDAIILWLALGQHWAPATTGRARRV